MLKIGVYAISLNEQQFAERWAKSAADADYLLVADTGSTDKTVSILKQNNVHVHHISVRPWRFDDARNAALALLPSELDVVIALDMDEILLPDWYQTIQENWNGGCNRLRYDYVWSWFNNEPDIIYKGDKIAGRHTHRWKHPVHEVLKPTVPEVVKFINETLIEHHPDDSKSRGQYLPLLELAVREDPTDDRNAHYLGREYFNYGRANDAINELYRHLDLPSAKWNTERAASMRYIAKSYEQLGDLDAANAWYTHATLEDKTYREALVDMARFTLARNNFHQTIHYCEQAEKLPSNGGLYLNERYALKEGPFDLASVAHFYLGNRLKAIELCEKAIALNPYDDHLRENLRMMKS